MADLDAAFVAASSAAESVSGTLLINARHNRVFSLLFSFPRLRKASSN